MDTAKHPPANTQNFCLYLNINHRNHLVVSVQDFALLMIGRTWNSHGKFQPLVELGISCIEHSQSNIEAVWSRESTWTFLTPIWISMLKIAERYTSIKWQISVTNCVLGQAEWWECMLDQCHAAKNSMIFKFYVSIRSCPTPARIHVTTPVGQDVMECQ